MTPPFEAHSAPKITVLMPVFNAGSYLKESVESVLSQSFSNFEILAIDDGSSDGSVAVLKSFNDPRLRLLINARNQGIPATLNRGVREARGQWIARMDQDDICRPDRLERQLRYMEAHPEVDLLFAFVDQIDSHGQSIAPWNDDRKYVTDSQIRNHMPFANCVAHPTLFTRRTLLLDYPYEEGERDLNVEDYELWLRCLDRGLKFAKIPEPLVRYRVHFSSITLRNPLPGRLRWLGIKSFFLGRVSARASTQLESTQLRRTLKWAILKDALAAVIKQKVPPITVYSRIRDGFRRGKFLA